ncbi:5-oxoprolinase subunit PxpB [uncultured Cohaesibacter sp.]|uniref:5-oxoprolinase subunit PxpB n=1 Tax=uncultured Cohaesibacter sp. TaxID=1002546 RepID=UPI0029C829F4|nr:5-oxoprolinase subunit PxpB [uncultured Cohaesibacter sp.]
MNNTVSLKIVPFGDSALLVQLGDRIDEAINERIIILTASLEQNPLQGICEMAPTYRSLLVRYDPAIIRGSRLVHLLTERASNLDYQQTCGRSWRIPVYYGGDEALDLDALAAEKNLDIEDIISLHSGAQYRVYMIGFSPGFAYLGGLPAALHTPRLETPRQRVAPGSIGIGGEQASINSLPGPSGWRFVGRTAVRLFDSRRPDPILLKAGDHISFFAVSREEIIELDARAAAGETIIEPNIQ